MNLFDYDDYRRFIRDYLNQLGRKGHGQAKKMAEHMGTHAVVVSQVLAGKRDFTLEQASDLSDYLGLSGLEEDYFLLLIQLSKAGTSRLSKKLAEKITAIKKRAVTVEERVPKDRELDDSAKAVFYSAWHYSAIRMLCSLPHIQSAEQIADILHLPPPTVREAIAFLKKQKLIRQEGKSLELLSKTTHIGQKTSYSVMHHRNWRLIAMQKKEINRETDMFYTAPMSLSVEDFAKVRAVLVKTIETLTKTVRASESEKAVCLNIDWFEF